MAEISVTAGILGGVNTGLLSKQGHKVDQPGRALRRSIPHNGTRVKSVSSLSLQPLTWLPKILRQLLSFLM